MLNMWLLFESTCRNCWGNPSGIHYRLWEIQSKPNANSIYINIAVGIKVTFKGYQTYLFKLPDYFSTIYIDISLSLMGKFVYFSANVAIRHITSKNP